MPVTSNETVIFSSPGSLFEEVEVEKTWMDLRLWWLEDKEWPWLLSLEEWRWRGKARDLVWPSERHEEEDEW